MANEINNENIQPLIDLVNNDSKDHPLEKLWMLFDDAMNDWPTQNKTNINEFLQELHNYLGERLTKVSYAAY